MAALPRAAGRRVDRRSSGFPLSPAVVIGLHAALFSLLAWWSWLKWPDPLIDFGRELYVPWQITRGRVLYRDVESLFGPLSPYMNAVLFRVCGVSLLTLVFSNLLIFAGIVAGVHRLVYLSTDRFTATVASLFALALFGFMHPARVGNYNFVTPYSHEATHGLALGVAMLIALHASLSGGRLAFAAIAGLAFGLILLTKPELSLAAAVAAAVAFVAAASVSGSGRQRRLVLLLFAAGTTLPCLSFFIYFLQHMAPAKALGVVARSWTAAFDASIATNAFYVARMGFDRPLLNLALTVVTFAGFLAYIAAMSALCLKAEKREISPTATDFGVVVLLAIAPVAMLLGFPRALPLIALAAAGIAGMSFVRSRHDHRLRFQWLALLMWSTFAFTLMAKLGLNASVHHYGFSLALPAGSVLAVVLCWLVPRQLARLGSDRAAARFRSLSTAAIALSVVPWLALSNKIYRTKTVSIGAGRDRFYASAAPDQWQGGAVRDAVGALESLRRTGDTLAVLPEGVMVNYLARLDSPLRVVNLMPPELYTFGEDEILEALRAAPPRFVLLVHKDMSEYGFPPFGSEPRYGQRTHSWIVIHYRTIRRFGADARTSSGYGMELMERQQ